MTTSAISSQKQTLEPVNRGRIWLAGLLGMVGAVAVNLIVRAILFAVLPLPVEFPPFQAGAIVMLTGIGALLAAVVYALIARFTSRPVTVFRWVALVALILSILPNLALAANPTAIPFPFPGASGLAFGVLIVFHVAAALVSVLILTGMTLKKA